MKHLLKKISLIGAGGGGKPERPLPPPPAKLEPPKIGVYSPYSSNNQIEIVDLLCDGPIEGLVNPLGRALEIKNILEGIYLDDTPISTSTSVSDSNSEVFNDFSLNTNIAKTATFLGSNQSAANGSGLLTTINNANKSGLTTYLTNNLRCLLINAQYLSYGSSWSHKAIEYASPGLEKSGEWDRITSVSTSVLNGTSVNFKYPSNLFYFRNKFTPIEIHVLSTMKYAGIAYEAKNAWDILKDNVGINQYEREIIRKKIALIDSISTTHTQLDDPISSWWPQSTGGWFFIPVSTTYNRTTFSNLGIKSGTTDADKSVIKGGKLINFGFFLKNSGFESSLILDCIIPEIDENNFFTGRVYGFIGIKIPCVNQTLRYSPAYHDFRIYKTNTSLDIINSIAKSNTIAFSKNIQKISSAKYNYNNILCEVKYGLGDQAPLNYFNKIYLDKEYKNKLIGPFRTVGQIKRFEERSNLLNPPFPDRSITYNASDSRVYLSNHFLSDGDKVQIWYQSKNVTLDATTDTVQFANHPLSNGLRIRFVVINTTTGISKDTWYYVRNSTTNSFQLSTKATNAIINFTNNGTADIDLQYTSGITSLTNYFVRNATPNSFQLATAATGGTILDIIINNSATLVTIDRRSPHPRDGILVGGNPNLVPSASSTNAEGSEDSERISLKGSYTELQKTFDEEAIPVTHIVENSEAESVIITLLINELSDTLTKQTDVDGFVTSTASTDMEAPGTKIPTVVSIRIETGKDNNGSLSNVQTYDYTIYGNIPSATLIDIGNPNNDLSKFNFISQPTNGLINQPFSLAPLSSSEINTNVKRYVKIYKISTETHSVLVRKELYVQKVTEIVNSQFSYPYSAIVGMKLDARSLSSIPIRAFDCRLKKIKIPSNYNVMVNGYDIRYQTSQSTYENAGRQVIYDGDWDGSFKIGWTDNPAWILYDILINKRYGLGRYIDESQINVWDLYKIGRYCDAVSDNGYYFGVSDGRGGLEPRFSCNILFNSPTKVFDAINIVANLFRGSVFFSHGEVNFSDDRPKEPTSLFNNSNVKDGIFNYITNKKEDIFNTVEVAYLDRFDNFKTKIELVEDPEDIRQRGVQKTVVNTLGVTSKAMARRIGQHVIWQTIKENQAIEFTAGLESLLCKPGDLIIIDDELKSRNINCGKILSVDETNKTLTLSNLYDNLNFDGYIDIYTPTGFLTREELFNKAISERNRLSSFILTTTANSSVNQLTGSYFFSQYDENNMAFYSGYNPTLKYNIYCYYDIDESAYVFSTGFAYERNNTYDKLITNTFLLNSDIRDNLDNVYIYNFGLQRQTAAINIKSNLTYGLYNNNGIFDNEIITQSPRQITTYRISGATNNINDGSIVYLNPNNFNLNLLSIVEPGSSYRIGLKSQTKQTYKVISIREENQNEYLVVATKYDTNKWSAIENDNVIENPQQIFYDNTLSRILSLETPSNLYLDVFNETSSGFHITGSFDGGNDIFKITVENKAVGFKYEVTTGSKQFNIPNLNDLGRYDMTVTAIASNSSNLNSYPAKIQKFIGYQKTDISLYDRPYIESFKII